MVSIARAAGHPAATAMRRRINVRPEERPARIAARGRWLKFLGGGVVLLALAAIGTLQVLQTSETVATGYELRALETKRSRLAAEIRLLEAEVAESARVSEVEAAAIELGMVRPERTMRLAVGVAAPTSQSLPGRYIVRQPEADPPALAWWEQLLGTLPGLP